MDAAACIRSIITKSIYLCCCIYVYLYFVLFQYIGIFLKKNHPGTKLSEFSASKNDGTEQNEKAAYAALITAKKLKSR